MPALKSDAFTVAVKISNGTMRSGKSWWKIAERAWVTLETERNNASLMLFYVPSCIQKACLFNYIYMHMYLIIFENFIAYLLAWIASIKII